jgi:hypothetical protein
MASTTKLTERAKRARIDKILRCDPARTALLVVDMQHGFLDPGASLEVPNGQAIIPKIRRLIDCCRSLDSPVFFTQFVYSPAVPCLRGDPFGIEHLPAKSGQSTGYGSRSNNCLIGPNPGQGTESALRQSTQVSVRSHRSTGSRHHAPNAFPHPRTAPQPAQPNGTAPPGTLKSSPLGADWLLNRILVIGYCRKPSLNFLFSRVRSEMRRYVNGPARSPVPRL